MLSWAQGQLGHCTCHKARMPPSPLERPLATWSAASCVSVPGSSQRPLSGLTSEGQPHSFVSTPIGHHMVSHGPGLAGTSLGFGDHPHFSSPRISLQEGTVGMENTEWDWGKASVFWSILEGAQSVCLWQPNLVTPQLHQSYVWTSQLIPGLLLRAQQSTPGGKLWVSVLVWKQITLKLQRHFFPNLRNKAHN